MEQFMVSWSYYCLYMQEALSWKQGEVKKGLSLYRMWKKQRGNNLRVLFLNEYNMHGDSGLWRT